MIRKSFLIGLLLEVLFFISLFIADRCHLSGSDFVFPFFNIWVTTVFFFTFFLSLLIIFFSLRFLKEIELKDIFTWGAIFSLTFAAFYPLGSIDVFSYILYGRIAGVYHSNLFLFKASEFFEDPFFHYLINPWWAETNHFVYGPLWAIITALAAKLSGNFVFNLEIFRFIPFIFYFATGYLVYLITQSKKTVLIYMWNPFILYEFINNAHNDIALVFFIFLAIYLYKENKILFVLPALTLAFLIKAPALFLFPIFIIFLWRKPKFFKSAAISLGLIVIFYLPFYVGGKTFLGIFEQSRIFAPHYFSLVPFLLKGFIHSPENIYSICLMLFIIGAQNWLYRCFSFSNSNHYHHYRKIY